MAAGVAVAAVAHALRHARERVLYGAPITELDAVRALLGRMAAVHRPQVTYTDWEGFQVHGSVIGKVYNPWYRRFAEVQAFSAADEQFRQPLGADADVFRLQIEDLARAATTGSAPRGPTAWPVSAAWSRWPARSSPATGSASPTSPEARDAARYLRPAENQP